MSFLFIEYPNCSTCKNAKKFLDDINVSYTDRNIVQDTPTKDELKQWIELSGININKFFNTSGLLYRSMNLKEKLVTLNDEEKIELLSSNGMLIKRPLLISDSNVLIGFNKAKWGELFLK